MLHGNIDAMRGFRIPFTSRGRRQGYKNNMSAEPREPLDLGETLPAIPVPASMMFGGKSRFVNIYAPEIVRIQLPAAEIPPHPVRLLGGRGDSLSHLQHFAKRTNSFGLRTRLRYLSERIHGGRVYDLGKRVVYDARWVYNGNLAHVLQHHVATLGYIRSKTGIGPGDCVVVLERDAPALARELLNLIGYETIETHRSVRGHLVSVQQLKDVPYHLLPFAAQLQPADLPASAIRRPFIARRGTRRLTNEAEIEAIARSHGYTKVYMEELSLREQIALMRSADSILAIHGAALGHLCLRSVAVGDRPVDLHEILTPALVTDIFRNYVAVQGGSWRGCRGNLTSKIFHVVEETRDYKAAALLDFVLDPDALEACLAR